MASTACQEREVGDLRGPLLSPFREIAPTRSKPIMTRTGQYYTALRVLSCSSKQPKTPQQPSSQACHHLPPDDGRETDIWFIGHGEKPSRPHRTNRLSPLPLESISEASFKSAASFLRPRDPPKPNSSCSARKFVLSVCCRLQSLRHSLETGWSSKTPLGTSTSTPTSVTSAMGSGRRPARRGRRGCASRSSTEAAPPESPRRATEDNTGAGRERH